MSSFVILFDLVATDKSITLSIKEFDERIAKISDILSLRIKFEFSVNNN